VGTVTILQAER